MIRSEGVNSVKIIDALGKPCPIPVIEAKKALSEPGADCVLVKVDNSVAVQNLEKMAKGYGYGLSYEEKPENVFDVTISLAGKIPPQQTVQAPGQPQVQCGPVDRLVVVISKNTMGEGSEELGKILIKGFIYSLTELPVLPECLLFLNSGAFLTAPGSNTLEDIKKLEEKGTQVFTCGTCVNYYGLKEKPAVGGIIDMFGITEKMAFGSRVITI